MTKHVLEYEIRHKHDHKLDVIVKLTTTPKSEMLFNKVIEQIDNFLDVCYLLSNNYVVVITLDGMSVPNKYCYKPITIETLSLLLEME